jgi:DedD protein
MRYTADAAMESQGLRDIDRWKDKIEVRLDNRQVAFLFFGSALVACMLFILGVIVGKRLESRGRAVSPEIEDPLALLDRVATTSRNTAETGAGRGGPAVGQIALAPAESAVRPATAASPALPGAASPARTAAKAKPIALVPPPAPAHQAVTSSAASPLPPREAPKALEAPREPAAKVGKSRFALQIGSFLDRSEAEAFAKGFSPESPNVVVSELPGKGTWYRVRVGEFKAFKDAVDAKTTFERRYNKIALVVGPF